jgi:hypothetical protein
MGEADRVEGPDVDIDDETGPFQDASLLAFAPTRWTSVAGSAAVLTAMGVAAIVFTPTVVRIDTAYLDRVIPILGALGVAFGVISFVAGMRAYLTFTERDTARFATVQIVGMWIMSAFFVVSGIAGGFWPLTLFGISVSQSLGIVSASRFGGPGTWLDRIFTRLYPWFVGECLFVIVMSPVAALLSVGLRVPDSVSTRYTTDAFIMPVAGIVVLALLVRAQRRRRARARLRPPY